MKLRPSIQSFNEQGIRSNNEDFIICGDLPSNRGYFFTVCDGVGGVNNGEIASQLACQRTLKYLQSNESKNYDQQYIDGLIDYIEAAFDNFHNVEKMATTWATLILYSNNAVISHIGDSRIYHIRTGEVFYKTQDHSLVNEFVKNGIISIEEAQSHPQRNVITKAIQGKQIKPVKADTYYVHDIEKGDCFFLCTDGVWDSMSENQLLEILAMDWSNTKKTDFIKEQCVVTSMDNYSAFLVQII